MSDRIFVFLMLMDLLTKKDLKKMLELNKNYDFIFASRYLKGGSDDDTVVTYIGNKIFSLGKVMFSLSLNDILVHLLWVKQNHSIT